VTKPLPPGPASTGAGVGATGLWALLCGFIPDPALRSVALAISPGVGWSARILCLRVLHGILKRDALKSYQAVLDAIEIGKRSGASQEVLDEMKKTADMALLRYNTLIGTVNAADAELEKLSKRDNP
jgi:hypothetical protein